MKILKLTTKIIYWIIAAFLAIVAVLTAATTLLDNPAGIRLFNVMSGSMSPAVNLGSLVIVKSVPNYQVGDIITFKNAKDPLGKSTTTHRIVDIGTSADGIQYKTKGDANTDPDMNSTAQNAVLGKVMLILPYLGYLVAFARTTRGFILLIVVPATIIAYQQYLVFKKAIVEELDKRRWAKSKVGEPVVCLSGHRINLLSPKVKSRGAHQPYFNFLCLGLVFVLSFAVGFIAVYRFGITRSSYLDGETTSVSMAAAEFPVPPWVSLSLSADRKKISFTLQNINLYIKLSYQLTYDTDTVPQGLSGEIGLHNDSQITREFDLGTCSSGGTCVYHTGVKNFLLKVDLEDASGNKTSLQATL